MLEQKRCVIAMFIVIVSSAFSLHGCAPPLHAHNLCAQAHIHTVTLSSLCSSSLSFQVIEANVTLGDSQSQFVIRSDSQFGSYYRLLVSGQYDIKVTTFGYLPATRRIIYDTAGVSYTTLNFQLWKEIYGSEGGESVLYVVVMAVVIAVSLIAIVEVVWYRRSRRKRIAFLLAQTDNFDDL